MNGSYREKLRDPRWQKKRLEVMAAAKWNCEGCGDHTATLNVHHAFYVRGRDPWEYENEELACLCEPCHEEQHQLREQILREMQQLDRHRMTWAIAEDGTPYPYSGVTAKDMLAYLRGKQLRCGLVSAIDLAWLLSIGGLQGALDATTSPVGAPWATDKLRRVEDGAVKLFHFEVLEAMAEHEVLRDRGLEIVHRWERMPCC